MENERGGYDKKLTDGWMTLCQCLITCRTITQEWMGRGIGEEG